AAQATSKSNRLADCHLQGWRLAAVVCASELNVTSAWSPSSSLFSRAERLERDGQRRDAGFGGFLLQRRDLVGTIGNAAPAPFVFVAPLRVARHENFVEALRGRAGVHALDQRVHALAIVLLRHEQIGFHRQEEMADVLRAVISLVLVAHLPAVVLPPIPTAA